MINLIHPSSPFLIDQKVMPPLGLMYLASVLKRDGHDARIVDCATEEAPPGGDLYITATTPQIDEAIALAKGRDYSVIGGPHATVDPRPLLTHFSAVVVGEGEQAITEIVRTKPRGLVRTRRIKDLDTLPFPDRGIASNYNYLIDGKRATTMITSRGCNGRCAFCSRGVMAGKVRLRSVGNILAEIAQCMDLGFEAIQFYDDTIAIDKERLARLCTGINGRVVWRCFCRTDQVDADMLGLMAKSGCREVLYGIESGSQQLLDNIGKGVSVERQAGAIMDARRAGIRVKACFVVGLPGETAATVQDTARFIRRTRPDSMDVNILVVYPGSAIHLHPKKYDVAFGAPTWYKGAHSMYRSTVRTSALDEHEIERAREYLVSLGDGL